MLQFLCLLPAGGNITTYSHPLSSLSHTLSLFLSLAFLLTGSSSDKTSRGLLLLLYLLPPPALGKCVAANQRASPAVFTNGGAAEFCVVRCYVLVPGSGAGKLNKSSIIETRKLERIIIRWYCTKNDIVARVWFYRHISSVTFSSSFGSGNKPLHFQTWCHTSNIWVVHTNVH